jgi:hypothetical protein
MLMSIMLMSNMQMRKVIACLFAAGMIGLSVMACLGEMRSALVFSPDKLPAGKAGQPYQATITVTQNSTPLNTISVSEGDLPAGLEITHKEGEDSALISGTPQTAGTYKFTVWANC